jgi:hypothetical protein
MGWMANLEIVKCERSEGKGREDAVDDHASARDEEALQLSTHLVPFAGFRAQKLG